MNERDADRAEAVRQIAAILASAYLRLRFPEPLQKEVDCAENSRPHVTAGNTMRTETNRSTGLREQIEALRHMTVGQLKDKYRDIFGESSRSNHKQFLFRRVA